MPPVAPHTAKPLASSPSGIPVIEVAHLQKRYGATVAVGAEAGPMRLRMPSRRHTFAVATR